MWLIVLEALGALGVLGFLVWWTMFSGRQQGEIVTDQEVDQPASSPLDADDASRGGGTKLKG